MGGQAESLRTNVQYSSVAAGYWQSRVADGGEVLCRRGLFTHNLMLKNEARMWKENKNCKERCWMETGRFGLGCRSLCFWGRDLTLAVVVVWTELIRMDREEDGVGEAAGSRGCGGRIIYVVQEIND
jgi:hypothetical protein